MKYSFLYYFKELKVKIKTFFFPRQRWLYRKLPRHWIDLDSCVEICILERFRYFVEKEGCFKNTDYVWNEESKVLGEEIKKYYDLLTIRILALEKDLDKAWEKVPNFDLFDLNKKKTNYSENYGEIDRLENEIFDLKTEIMEWVIKRRDYLWT